MRHTSLFIIPLTLTITASLTNPAPAATGDPGGGYESQQGIFLHGTVGPSPFEGLQADIPFAGALAGDRFNHRLYEPFKFKAGELLGDIDGHTLKGADVVGTQLQARDHVLTIVRAEPHHNIYNDLVGTIWQYQVSWAPSNAPDAARPLCAPGYAAEVVPGSWRTGQLQRDPKVFTFACVPAGGYQQCATSSCDGGVIAKCIDLGYAPWKDGSAYLDRQVQLGPKFKLQQNNDSAVRLHNLCVAAMRADYDGNGHPHTIEGTPIRLFDATNVGKVMTLNRTSLAALNSLLDVARNVPRSLRGTALGNTRVGSLKMEGVWTVDKTGLARAACLEKTRWQTLDDTATSDCDSFVRLLCSGQKGPDCALSEIPLVISYSASIDRGLYRFSDGHNSITTTHVRSTADGLTPDPMVFCPSASKTSKTSKTSSRCDCFSGFRATFEGTVLSPDIRDLVTKHAKNDPLFANLHPLYSQRLGDCQTLTTTDKIVRPAPSAAQRRPTGNPADPPVLEGYLLDDAHVESSPEFSLEDLKLSLWTLDRDSVRSYITAVTGPQGAAAGSSQVLGYVLRRASKDLARCPLLSKLVSGPVVQR